MEVTLKEIIKDFNPEYNYIHSGKVYGKVHAVRK